MRTYMKAVRGATVSTGNTENEILDATKELLEKILEVNNIESTKIVSVIFTSTSDVTACFPGKAVRKMGFTDISVIDTLAPYIKDDIPLCIRLLLYVNTDTKLNHLYLREAKKLRPDR